MTELIKINNHAPEKSKIKKAAKVLKEGGLVAFPTDTVYGLGANALDEKAVNKVFRAKGRPSNKPLIILISNKKEVYKLAKEVPKEAEKLISKFWPGPLTLIFKKSKLVPNIISSGSDKIAIRMPDNKIALELIKEAKIPVTSPSANTSGKPSHKTAEGVLHDLQGKIDIIIDGGKTKSCVASTILDITTRPATVIRIGKLNIETLK